MQIDYNDIGRRIRAARMKKRVTQEQLAAAIDMGTTHISHIETANTVPSLKTFVADVYKRQVLYIDVFHRFCCSFHRHPSVWTVPRHYTKTENKIQVWIDKLCGAGYSKAIFESQNGIDAALPHGRQRRGQGGSRPSGLGG